MSPLRTADWWPSWRARVRQLERETLALYLAYRDPRTPWYAKVWAAIVVAYALSPIDLIPDFIPLLGYLDDLLLVPLGIALAIRLIPPAVLSDCRAQAARQSLASVPGARLVAGGIVLLWVLALAWVAWRLATLFGWVAR
jgi:uncharacterized membrane protein YkvA (DUF1232 family)